MIVYKYPFIKKLINIISLNMNICYIYSLCIEKHQNSAPNLLTAVELHRSNLILLGKTS